MSTSQPTPDEPRLPIDIWQRAMEELTIEEEEALMAKGFAFEEAVYLAGIRAGLTNNMEMRERAENDHRLQWAKWLVETGRLSEETKHKKHIH